MKHTAQVRRFLIVAAFVACDFHRIVPATSVVAPSGVTGETGSTDTGSTGDTGDTSDTGDTGVAAPSLTSVRGDGAGDRLGAGVIFTGALLDTVTSVRLGAVNGDASALVGTPVALTITAQAPSQLSAQFEAGSAALVQQLAAGSITGDYAFEVRNAGGADFARVQFQSGAQGATGATGPPGTPGVGLPVCNNASYLLASNGVSWSCAADALGSAGSAITQVTGGAGSGLSIVNSTTTPNISIAACPAGEILHEVGGNWTCSPDDRTASLPMTIQGSAAPLLTMTNAATAIAASATLANNGFVMTATNTGTGEAPAARFTAQNSTAGAQLEIVELGSDFARITLERSSGNGYWELAARTDGASAANERFNLYYNDGVTGTDVLQMTGDGVARVNRLSLNAQGFTNNRALVLFVHGDNANGCDFACGNHGMGCSFAMKNGSATPCANAIADVEYAQCFCVEQ